jgi:orotate phosphoribosyltransferase
MAAIFTYGFPISEEKIKEANLDVYTLSNYDNLLQKAIDKKYISENELETLQTWNANPAEWGVVNE